MTDAERRALEDRIQLVFELVEDGIELTRERLKRERPDAVAAEIDAAIEAWLRERRGAPFGDSEGRLISFPRR